MTAGVLPSPPTQYTGLFNRSQQRGEGAVVQDYFWDEHGRRYARRGERVRDGVVVDRDRASGEVDVALETVR